MAEIVLVIREPEIVDWGERFLTLMLFGIIYETLVKGEENSSLFKTKLFVAKSNLFFK